VGKANAAIELARRAVATADHPGRVPCLARDSMLLTADHRTPQPSQYGDSHLCASNASVAKKHPFLFCENPRNLRQEKTLGG